MKHLTIGGLLLAVVTITTIAVAADKAAITSNVDRIVAQLEAGKEVMGFRSDRFEPYAFIMQEDGTMLVHPTLTGKSLKEQAPPVYEALLQASPDGVWVAYEWQGQTKHTFARRTANNLIVGSGY